MEFHMYMYTQSRSPFTALIEKQLFILCDLTLDVDFLVNQRVCQKQL